jgi:Arc/MetJ-type ribon-helix-helix transcriptional regulator
MLVTRHRQCIPLWYADCMTMVQIAVRIPSDLVGSIDRLATATDDSRSEVVRRAIEAYLYRQACEADASRYNAVPLSDSELTLADDPSGWRPTPAW